MITSGMNLLIHSKISKEAHTWNNSTCYYEYSLHWINVSPKYWFAEYLRFIRNENIWYIKANLLQHHHWYIELIGIHVIYLFIWVVIETQMKTVSNKWQSIMIFLFRWRNTLVECKFSLLIMYPRILWKARQIFRVEKVSHNVPGARVTEKKKKNLVNKEFKHGWWLSCRQIGS